MKRRRVDDGTLSTAEDTTTSHQRNHRSIVNVFHNLLQKMLTRSATWPGRADMFALAAAAQGPCFVPCLPLSQDNIIQVQRFSVDDTSLPDLRGAADHISAVPVIILDAPNLVDDFYCQPLAWSTINLLAVALEGQVFLWNPINQAVLEMPCDSIGSPSESEDSSTISELSLRPRPRISCISWRSDGNVLAIGRIDGVLQIWNIITMQIIHTLTFSRGNSQSSRIFSLAWHPKCISLLAVGTANGCIFVLDCSIAAPQLKLLGNAHRQSVCSLSWNNVGTYLASGGNDNQVYVWGERTAMSWKKLINADVVVTTSATLPSLAPPSNPSALLQPKFALRAHLSAVRALAWSHEHPNLLATGGGVHDCAIRFWSMLTGEECLPAIQTQSQVCNLMWSALTQELLSTHGFNENCMHLWRPLTKHMSGSSVLGLPVASFLRGHQTRMLFMTASPDGRFVATAAGGADETIRIWNVFPSSDATASPTAVADDRMEPLPTDGESTSSPTL